MFKKYIALIAFVCMCSCATDDATPEPEIMEVEEEMEVEEVIFEGDVWLQTQEEIDSFGEIGYTKIIGNLQINDVFQPDTPILSLSALHTLTSVEGSLSIGRLYEVTSLEGLNNLTSISDELYLGALYEVDSFLPLSNITATVDIISIDFCRKIESLSGLEGISLATAGELIIKANQNLLNLEAIRLGMPSSLGSVTFDAYQPSCTSCVPPSPAIPQPFTDFNFLSNVSQINSLWIRFFVGEELTGLENLTRVNQLYLYRNHFLVDLEPLQNIISENEFMIISSNDLLSSLSGLENINSIGGFFVTNNMSITNYCAVENVLSLDIGVYQVENNFFNPTLEDVVSGNCSN